MVYTRLNDDPANEMSDILVKVTPLFLVPH